MIEELRKCERGAIPRRPAGVAAARSSADGGERHGAPRRGRARHRGAFEPRGLISGVAATYQRFDYAGEKRTSAQTWANFLDNLTAEKPANVVRLAGGKR